MPVLTLRHTTLALRHPVALATVIALLAAWLNPCRMTGANDAGLPAAPARLIAPNQPARARQVPGALPPKDVGRLGHVSAPQVD